MFDYDINYDMIFNLTHAYTNTSGISQKGGHRPPLAPLLGSAPGYSVFLSSSET